MQLSGYIQSFFGKYLTPPHHSLGISNVFMFGSHSRVCERHSVKFIGSSQQGLNQKPFSDDKAPRTCEITAGEVTSHLAAKGKCQPIHLHRQMALLHKTLVGRPCTSCSSTLSGTLERNKRQGCVLYLGDLCWYFGHSQCLGEGIGQKCNQIQ